MKILFAGGGTGGHIFPLVAIIQSLRELTRGEVDLLWLNSGKEIEIEAAHQYNIPYKIILCGKIRRYFSLWNVIDFFKSILGFWQSLWIIFKFQPDAIFVKGGFVSFPVILAGLLLGKKVCSHESDRVLGLVNSIFLPFFKKVFLTFPLKETEKYQKYKSKFILTGHPVRTEFLMQRKVIDFQLNPRLKTILVLGGSQGAAKINTLLKEILVSLLKRYNILHLMGSKTKNKYFSGKENKEGVYRQFKFLSAEELNSAYEVAHLVVSRAGSGALAELSLKALPTLLIPYPYSARSHQLANAYFLKEKKAAIVLEESRLSSKKLFKTIQKILENEKLLKRLSKNIKVFATREAAFKIAQFLIANLLSNVS